MSNTLVFYLCFSQRINDTNKAKLRKYFIRILTRLFYIKIRWKRNVLEYQTEVRKVIESLCEKKFKKESNNLALEKKRLDYAKSYDAEALFKIFLKDCKVYGFDIRNMFVWMKYKI